MKKKLIEMKLVRDTANNLTAFSKLKLLFEKS